MFAQLARFFTVYHLTEDNLRYSMALAPLIIGPSVVLWAPFIRKLYRQQYQQLDLIFEQVCYPKTH